MCIAEHPGVGLNERMAAEIASLYSLDANKKRAAELSERLRAEGADLSRVSNTEYRDRNSELHWNHIREGESGRGVIKPLPRQ